MTDDRALKYGADFPARALHAVPVRDAARRLAGRQGGRRRTAVARASWRRWRMIGRIRPSVVVGFGGYPTVPPIAGGVDPRGAGRAARAECRDGQGQPLRGATARRASPRAFRRSARPARRPRRQGDLHRQSRPARRASRRPGAPCRTSRAGGTHLAARHRRLAGRPRHVRHRAGRRGAARAERRATACASSSRRAARTRRACATPMRRLGVARRGAALLRRPAGPHGRRPSRGRPRRRLHGQRTRRHRPRRRAGAVSPRARPGPGRQCRHAGAQRRRHRARSGAVHARMACGRAARAC